MTRSRNRLAPIALALASSAALAQPVSMPRQVEDVVSVEVEGGLEHHSNLFRLPNGPSDTVLRGLLGLRFERDVSLQRLAAFANVQPVKYLDFSSYDYVGWAAGGTWDWEVGRPVFGTLAARYDRTQSSFESIGLAQNNLIDILFLRGLIGFRITQAWSLFGAADYRDAENSLASQKPSDATRMGYETGLRYAPGTGTQLDLFYRRESNDQPNRQVFDASGNLLPGGIDNAFSADALLARIAYRPNEATRIAGSVGYTKRAYDNVPQRDFSGVTAGLDFEWPLSGQVQMRASVYRTIDSAELQTASYADVTGVGLRPSWQMTSRVLVDGILTYNTRKYKGDPGFVFTGAPVREDKFLDYGIRVNYEFARRVFFYGDLRRADRSSNYSAFEFTDNWFGFGVRALY